MMNMALAVLDGNLTRDPETKTIKTNKRVTTFDIALNHEWGNKDGNKSVSYVRIETWERLAENCANYLKKGSYVLVDGSIRQERWQDDNGKMQSRIKIIARNVHFRSSRQEEKEEAA